MTHERGHGLHEDADFSGGEDRLSDALPSVSVVALGVPGAQAEDACAGA